MWWDNWLKSTQNVLLYRCACDNLTLLVGKVIQATVSDIVFLGVSVTLLQVVGFHFQERTRKGAGGKMQRTRPN